MGCLFIWGSLSLGKEEGAVRGLFKETAAQVNLCYAQVSLPSSLKSCHSR